MQALNYKTLKKIEFFGYDIICDLKRLSEEIDYSITINKRTKVFKGLKKVFYKQKNRFNAILNKIDDLACDTPDSLKLKTNLYKEYINFLDRIIFLKHKENDLDNIRIIFNKHFNNGIVEKKSNLTSVKNFKVLFGHLYKKNFDKKKKYVINDNSIKQIVYNLASITKYIENNNDACYSNVIEIELLINLIFRYLTLLKE